jgi:hypothetical protein
MHEDASSLHRSIGSRSCTTRFNQVAYIAWKVSQRLQHLSCTGKLSFDHDQAFIHYYCCSRIMLRSLYSKGTASSMVHAPSNSRYRLTSSRHTFSNTEKSAYINAELCLMQKPATIGLPSAKTRFDELQAVHQLQAYATHYVVRVY